MTGIIISIPPTPELPPGSTSGGTNVLPPVTYQYANINLPQTWGAKQTFPAGMISLNASDILGLATSATSDTTNASNITSGTLAGARLPTPTTSVLGGIKAIAAVPHNWISAIDTSGNPILTQPSFADISGTSTIISGPGAATVGNITYWSNAGGTTVAATPALQAGNPGQAGLYSIISTAPTSGTTLANALQVDFGGSFNAAHQFGVNTSSVNQTIVGTMSIASGSSIVQGQGVAGYADTQSNTNSSLSTPPGAVGVFGQGSMGINGANCFGSNFIAENITGSVTTGFNPNFIAAIETDTNLWQNGGVNPTVSSDNAYGIFVSGGGNFTGTIGSGIGIQTPSFSTGKWNNAIKTFAGAATNAFVVGPIATGNSQASQNVLFQSTNSSGVAKTASIFSDLNGALYVSPQSGTQFIITGASLQIVSMSTAGVLVNDASGNVSSAANGQLPATATNDNASAGKVGEYIDTSSGPQNANATVTITIASPAVVTWTSHLFRVGGATTAVVFTTTGALPTGITAGTTYYLKAIDANTFNIATSVANALAGTFVNTSGSQSGTQSASVLVSMSSTINQDIAGISLTAGDWEVTGVTNMFANGGTTTVTNLSANLTTTTATTDLTFGRRTSLTLSNNTQVVSANAPNLLFVGPARFSLSSTTTIFLVGNATFGTSTLLGAGWIRARRVR